MLRILIADDNNDLRRRIRLMIESQNNWVVCGEAGNGREALELTDTLLPDVILLDVSMPEIGGLEVMRRLAAAMRDIDVIVMSAHRTNELAREVIRAGARAFIDKAEAYERLTPALKALRREVRLAGRVIGSRHIGGFFHSLEEAYRIRANGQLELLTWESADLRNARFDMTAMLDLVHELLRNGPRSGYPRSRLMARMEWALQDLPGVDSLIEYETRLNYILPQYDDIVTCCYDLSRFDADVIADVMLEELQQRN